MCFASFSTTPAVAHTCATRVMTLLIQSEQSERCGGGFQFSDAFGGFDDEFAADLEEVPASVSGSAVRWACDMYPHCSPHDGVLAVTLAMFAGGCCCEHEHRRVGRQGMSGVGFVWGCFVLRTAVTTVCRPCGMRVPIAPFAATRHPWTHCRFTSDLSTDIFR